MNMKLFKLLFVTGAVFVISVLAVIGVFVIPFFAMFAKFIYPYQNEVSVLSLALATFVILISIMLCGLAWFLVSIMISSIEKIK